MIDYDWNSHDIQHRVISQHLMGDVHNEVETAVSVLDTGGVSRPHLEPDGQTRLGTNYNKSPEQTSNMQSI